MLWLISAIAVAWVIAYFIDNICPDQDDILIDAMPTMRRKSSRQVLCPLKVSSLDGCHAESLRLRLIIRQVGNVADDVTQGLLGFHYSLLCDLKLVYPRAAVP